MGDEKETYPYLGGKVEDVMTVNPMTIGEDAPMTKLIDAFAKYKFHGLPVVNEKGDLAGLVRDSDLMSIFARKEPAAVKFKEVKDIMQVPPFVIGPEESIQQAVYKMFADGTRILVVTEKDRSIIGVVTRIDLIRGIRWREE